MQTVNVNADEQTCALHIVQEFLNYMLIYQKLVFILYVIWSLCCSTLRMDIASKFEWNEMCSVLPAQARFDVSFIYMKMCG